jgi:hypothetical protein
VEIREFRLAVSRNASQAIKPLAKHSVYAEGNMTNILETVPINIYKTPNVVENIFIGEKCSQDEIHWYTKLLRNLVMFSLGSMRKCLA